MRLTYISSFKFRITDNKAFALPAYGNNFWIKYLDVFDSIYVIGEKIPDYLSSDKMIEITDERIKIDIIEANTHPKDLLNDRVVKNKLDSIIKNSEYLLIKPSSRKGIMAIKLAKKYNKPYMIEITGDLNKSLSEKNLLKRLYAPIIYNKILHAIKDCEFGLYVSQEYLQKIYPIKGLQCGCSDVIIKEIKEDVLTQRSIKIKNTDLSELKIGLIGYYHDRGKGIDTAIEALSIIKEKNLKLFILGVGTQEDREKWYKYGEEHGFTNIEFPQPIQGTENMMKWLDGMDMIILPSRSEGLPRCIIEAMSRACPCITSNVCGLTELISKEWLHEAGDYKGLSILIREVINSKENLINMANTNFHRAKEYEYNLLVKRRNVFLQNFVDRYK